LNSEEEEEEESEEVVGREVVTCTTFYGRYAKSFPAFNVSMQRPHDFLVQVVL
jgi:hypothetical protein